MAALALRYFRSMSPPAPVLRRASVAGRRSVSRSCDGPRPRPSPPCRPAPQPACRPRPPAPVQRGVRVVCCAPPQGARPPCAPPAPSPPLTCAERTGSSRMSRCVPKCEEGEATGRCGHGQDRVARRLDLAKASRRADYEREAAARTPRPPAPLAPYTLGEDRVCTRATDGREYALPCAPSPTPRCGPARAPPAPRCVSLRSDDACRVSDGRLDPCAQRPRIFVEVDRGTPPRAAPPATPASAPAQRSLTSRIMDGLGRGRRPSGPCGCAGETSRRRLHTSAVNSADEAPRDERNAGSIEKGAGARGLAAMLRERATLAEAGRGRVAARCAAGASDALPPAGRLELPVPSGAARVTVCVSLAAAKSSPEPPPAGTASAPILESGGAECGSPSGPRGSWLSLKTIQRRFAARRRSDTTGGGGACPPGPSRRPAGAGCTCSSLTPASPPKPHGRCPPNSKQPLPCADRTPPRASPGAEVKPTQETKKMFHAVETF